MVMFLRLDILQTIFLNSFIMAAAWWVIQLAEEEERRHLKLQRRQLRDAANPFEILESQFLFLYR